MALAIIPHSLSIFAAAVLVSGLYDRLTLRNIARLGFVVVAAGLMLLAVMIRKRMGHPAGHPRIDLEVTQSASASVRPIPASLQEKLRI